jgi:hypothetical protein
MSVTSAIAILRPRCRGYKRGRGFHRGDPEAQRFFFLFPQMLQMEQIGCAFAFAVAPRLARFTTGCFALLSMTCGSSVPTTHKSFERTIKSR